MRAAERSEEISAADLQRRRRAARGFGLALGAGVLLLYVAGFWLPR